ncbi:MAG: CPBP family glutamic-type intramembrane protease [Steroidobacteraceae bacterium]
MRAARWFLAAILGTLLLAALVAYPAWQLAQALEPEWQFHKVVSRLWQLLLLAGLVLALRRLGLRSREAWGYALPRSRFLRQFGSGLALGLASMLPMSLAMLAFGILRPEPGLGAAAVLDALAAGAAIGLAVALVEETFFRGLMFGAVARESGFAAALWFTALLYSAVHFLGRTPIPADEIGWASGLTLLGSAFANFAQPAAIVDSFVTLVLVGLLLGCVRQRSGAIAAGIGLHMGWVWVIQSTGALTDARADSRWSFLVSDFDGYTGWLVGGWAALLLAIAWTCGWLGAPRAAHRQDS